MSDKIVAVLVVPTESDTAGLLMGGLCGCPVPTAYQRWVSHLQTWATEWDLIEVDRSSGWCSEDPPHEGLVLWWDGRVCEEGWDRFRRIMYEATADGHHFPERLFGEMRPTVDEVRMVALDAVRVRIATRVVCLNLDGAEVTP